MLEHNILLFVTNQPTHDVRTTLYGRCYDVKMLKQRRYNVIFGVVFRLGSFIVGHLVIFNFPMSTARRQKQEDFIFHILKRSRELRKQNNKSYKTMQTKKTEYWINYSGFLVPPQRALISQWIYTFVHINIVPTQIDGIQYPHWFPVILFSDIKRNYQKLADYQITSCLY